MFFYLHMNCWCSPWCRQNTGEIYGMTIWFVVSLLFCQTPGPGVERIFVAFNLSFGLGMVKSKLKFQVIQVNHPAVACPTLQDLLLRLLKLKSRLIFDLSATCSNLCTSRYPRAGPALQLRTAVWWWQTCADVWGLRWCQHGLWGWVPWQGNRTARCWIRYIQICRGKPEKTWLIFVF